MGKCNDATKDPQFDQTTCDFVFSFQSRAKTHGPESACSGYMGYDQVWPISSQAVPKGVICLRCLRQGKKSKREKDGPSASSTSILRIALTNMGVLGLSMYDM